MEERIKFIGKNFSIEMVKEVVDDYGLSLWTTDASTHDGRWCKVMHAKRLIDLIVDLENWDEFLDEGVSENEKIIIRQKEEYKVEMKRRFALAKKLEILRRKRI